MSEKTDAEQEREIFEFIVNKKDEKFLRAAKHRRIEYDSLSAETRKTCEMIGCLTTIQQYESEKRRLEQAYQENIKDIDEKIGTLKRYVENEAGIQA